MNAIFHTRSSNAADILAVQELQAEHDRRADLERFAPVEPWQDQERHRRFEVYQLARLRNEDLGVLMYCLIALRKAAVDADADEITPVVQQWIDEWQPVKTEAVRARDEACEAVTSYRGEK